jgi:hypothetical protein
MRRLMRTLIAPLVLLTGSCGDDPFSPTIENVAGSYVATALTATESGLTTNLLNLGASLEIVLDSDGTTAGRLFAPGLGDGGEDIDVDLGGTWALEGEVVTFEQQGDTFVRDVPFMASRNQLQAEDTFGTVLIRVTLTK